MAINTTKVLLVVTKGNWGGAQRYVYDLATSLPHTDFDVKVAYGEGETLSKRLEESKIPSLRIPSLARDFSLIKDVSVFWSLLKLFRAEKPDIVHLNSSKIGGLGALAARFSGIKKIIFTVHGFAFNEERPWLQKKIIVFLSWLTVALSTKAIFISKIEYGRALKWPFIRRKLRFVPNGISATALLDKKTAEQTLLASAEKPADFFENKTVVISIGELTKNKGYEYAISAFKDLDDFAYMIIGGGEERASLEKIIAENNATDRVVLAGFVAGAPSFLKAADIFLLSSIKEGLPYVILEAGMARLPIVSTSVGGIPDVIDDGISGILVAPRNPKAIGDALRRFGSDEALRKLCASNLEQKILAQYNKDSMIKNTILVYNM